MMTPMILTAILLSATPVSSAETAWRACIDRTGTNLEWSRCSGVFVQEADAALNAKWAQLMAVAEGKTKADLVAEERAWVAYRETACRFYRNGDWGREGEVLHGPGCVAAAIEQRTQVLSGYLAFLTQR